MSEDLAGRLAVVTGGGGGIGAACAIRLAAAGASVVVADINSAPATAVADRIGGRAFEGDLAAGFDAAALAGQGRGPLEAAPPPPPRRSPTASAAGPSRWTWPPISTPRRWLARPTSC